jgi:hypothetical protein
MIMVTNWQDSDMIDKEVKTCDNKETGKIKEVKQPYLIVRQGESNIRIPRSAVGTFDDGKIYFRVAEAEVLSGMYPFLDSELRPNWQSTESATTPQSSNNQPPATQDVLQGA